MIFYKRFPGDYGRDTVHLSMMEDGAYNRLMDFYYSTEKPLPLDRKIIYRIARATQKAEQRAVDSVLAEFFTHGEEGYRQKRIDAEIVKSKPKAAANQENGKKGGRPKKDQNDNPTDNPPNNPMGFQNKPSGEPALVNHSHSQNPETTKPLAESSSSSLSEATAALPGSRIGDLCKKLRTLGINAAPGQFQKPDWIPIFERFDDAFIVAVAESKRASMPDKSISAAYLLPVLTDLLKPPSQQTGNGTGYESARDRSRRETNEALTGKNKNASRPNLIDIN